MYLKVYSLPRMNKHKTNGRPRMVLIAGLFIPPFFGCSFTLHKSCQIASALANAAAVHISSHFCGSPNFTPSSWVMHLIWHAQFPTKSYATFLTYFFSPHHRPPFPLISSYQIWLFSLPRKALSNRSRCIAALVWIAPFMASAIHFLDPLLWGILWEHPGVTNQQENNIDNNRTHERIWNQFGKIRSCSQSARAALSFNLELDTFAVEKHHSNEGQTPF